MNIQDLITQALTSSINSDITIESTFIPVLDLKPTQTGLDANSVLGSINDTSIFAQGNPLELKDIIVGTPIIVLNNEWIIDGHHRWAKLILINPAASISAISINSGTLTVDEVIESLHTLAKHQIGVSQPGKVVDRELRNLTMNQLNKFTTDWPPHIQQMFPDKYIHTNLKKIPKAKEWKIDREEMPQLIHTPDQETLLGLLKTIELK